LLLGLEMAARGHKSFIEGRVSVVLRMGEVIEMLQVGE
jgi:hypothetical protein